jgi:hypothetical protein
VLLALAGRVIIGAISARRGDERAANRRDVEAVASIEVSKYRLTKYGHGVISAEHASKAKSRGYNDYQTGGLAARRRNRGAKQACRRCGEITWQTSCMRRLSVHLEGGWHRMGAVSRERNQMLKEHIENEMKQRYASLREQQIVASCAACDWAVV